MTHICAAILVSLMLASVALAAERRSVALVCRGALPFDRKQLLAAINLRLPLMRIDLQGDLPAVQVQALPPDQASIKVGTSRRIISLRGLSREDAARVVALLTLDLISNQQKKPAPVRPAPAPGPGASDFVFVGVSPRVSLGVSQWNLAFEPTVDINIKVSRHFLVYLECGFTWAGAGEDQRELTLLEIPLRVGAAFRYRWFEARAGAALRPYFVSGRPTPARAGEDQGVLVGGGLGLYFRRALSRWLTGYAALGVDFYHERKELRVAGETTLTTGWAVPWLGLGAGWQGG